MASPFPLRAELLAERKRPSFYGRELSEGRSDEELAAERARLQTDRQTIKRIFHSRIFGPD